VAERLVVIGGDAGGMTAAAQARRRRGRDELEIVAFERTPYTSYSACGIPFFVGDLVPEVAKLVARSPEEHRRRGIDVQTRHEVVGLDLERRSVRVQDLASGAEREERFDQLVVATGATPLRPPIPGIDAKGVYGVQTLADGIAVRHVIDGTAPELAVVIGGGYIGLELAEALVMRGLDVSLVEQGEQPMSMLDPDMGALVADALRGVGVKLHLEKTVESFELDGDRVRAVHTDAGVLPADLVILGLGVRPDSALASDAGLPVGESGGVRTDDRMATEVDGVWAAGDCVENRHRLTGRGVAIALGTYANKQGRVAGINITGGDARFPGVLGTAASKICAYEVARTGLTEREAAVAGFDALATTIEATARAGYYPGASALRVKLVFERTGGRVLGGQIVGREGAAKRIDVVAVAIWNEMTVDEMINLDLSYSPPFSPVWDPVLVAARSAAGGFDA
jgi:NADPH-dependent 2,4-dienoyl-CoA reductase/sulfur reductase-like enzyme